MEYSKMIPKEPVATRQNSGGIMEMTRLVMGESELAGGNKGHGRSRR